MNESIWSRETELPQFPKLKGDLKTDVLIIGGGMAGLLCAELLRQEGIRCALIEADRIMGGVSANTTAKITSQHGLCYSKILKEYGPETAHLYWQANEKALEMLVDMAKGADCDLERKDHFVYTTGDVKELAEEMMALEQAGIPAGWAEDLKLPFAVTGGIRFDHQAQFHPLKFAAAISKNLHIYEKTEATAFVGNTVVTNHGKITAEKIIVATHFPILNKHGAYFLKLYQQRSYVLALEKAGQVEGMYLSARENGPSFRNVGDVLLIGGGGHRTGKQGRCWDAPREIAQRYFPGAEQVCHWATQDCMTLDGIPYIGQYGKVTPNLYVATGFNKWGMTSSMVSAMILRDLVQDRKNMYASVFSPQRRILHPQLLCNGWESVVHLLKPTTPRCPHLGCALKWNPQEHSWDCPCHGSRFDKEGKLLNNPSTGNLKKPPPIN